MTLLLKLEQDVVEMYLHTENEDYSLVVQKLQPEQTDRETDRYLSTNTKIVYNYSMWEDYLNYVLIFVKKSENSEIDLWNHVDKGDPVTKTTNISVIPQYLPRLKMKFSSKYKFSRYLYLFFRKLKKYEN